MNKTIEQIAKIRRLAEDAQGTEEAQTALLMYQKLLVKHGLSEADIVIKNSTQVIEENSLTVERLEKWILHLFMMIGKQFRCKTITRKIEYVVKHSNTSLMFLGEEADVEIAKAAFLTAKETAERMLKLSREKSHYKVNRSEYMLGFVTGLERAYKEQVVEFGLCVVIPESVTKELEGRKYKNQEHKIDLKSSISSFQGYTDGFETGQRKKVAG